MPQYPLDSSPYKDGQALLPLPSVWSSLHLPTGSLDMPAPLSSRLRQAGLSVPRGTIHSGASSNTIGQ